MRDVPSIDQKSIEMFGLDPSDSARANAILASLGRDSMESVAAHALDLPERCVDAALWRCLAHHAPWPWLGAELNATLAHKCEQQDGRKLFCALIARQAHPDRESRGAPPHLAEPLARMGAIAGLSMASPRDLSTLGHRGRLALAKNIEAGLPLGLCARLDDPALGAWALPILYTPARHGDYSAMDERTRALLSSSLAEAVHARLGLSAEGGADGPRDLMLGFGPFSSMLELAPSLCAPLSLRSKIHRLRSSLIATPQGLACSVSFHRDSDMEWMRVALRPAETGFCLAGLDWPCGPGGHEEAFDRLLDTLSACEVEWCHQVVGIFDSQICLDCGEPVYPTPRHDPWRACFLEAGAPPDGSHPH